MRQIIETTVLFLSLLLPLEKVLADIPLAEQCFVWQPEKCSSSHRKADAALIEAITRKGATREAGAAEALKTGWAALFKDRDPKRGLRRFNQALILDPRSAEGYWGAGTSCAVLGMSELAEKLLLKSTELNPKLSGPFINLGRLYAGDPKKYAKAEKYLKVAIQLEPRSAEAHQMLAVVFANEGKKSEAKLLYDRAVALGGKTDPVFERKLSGN